MKVSKEDSLNKRYFAKITGSLIVIPIGFITSAIIPRSLGPTYYGQFTFLTGIFSKMFELTQAGFPTAYYTKLSQNLNEKGIIKFFFGFRFICSITIAILTSIIFLLNFQEYVWPNQNIKFIYMALFFSILALFSNTASNTVDALGLTVKGEMISVLQKYIGFCIILLLFFLWKIDITIFFFYQYFSSIFLLFGCYYVMSKGGVRILSIPPLTRVQIKRYISEFWVYSNPLIVLGFITSVTSILDLWMLEKFSGSIQQGYYGLAVKIAAITFLFSRAMTPLITREFSVAFGKGDLSRMKILFKRYIPLLYTIAAFICVFISVEASTVSVLYGGDKYRDASFTISIFAFYPIHQTYGQLSGAVFLATGQTKLHRNITGIMRIGGLLLSFFLLAPTSYYGFDMGAQGLAIKMLIYQFLLVNIQLYYNSKYLSMKLSTLIYHQIIVIGIFFLFAAMTTYLSDILTSSVILSFFISGTLYLLLCSALIYKYPRLVSASREEIDKFKKKLVIRLQKRISTKKSDSHKL